MQIDNGKVAKNTHGYNFHFYPTTLAYINLPLSLEANLFAITAIQLQSSKYTNIHTLECQDKTLNLTGSAQLSLIGHPAINLKN